MDNSTILAERNGEQIQKKLQMSDWRIGDKASVSKTISETDVYLFAGITGDFNPVHVNQVIAQKSFVHVRIAHGALISGMISTVIGMQLPGPGTIYMEQDSRFLQPVCIGDTITAIVEIAELVNSAKRIMKLRTCVMNQKDELVLDGYAIVKAPISE